MSGYHGGYDGGRGFGSGFAFVLVLFILLVIVGANSLLALDLGATKTFPPFPFLSERPFWALLFTFRNKKQ